MEIVLKFWNGPYNFCHFPAVSQGDDRCLLWDKNQAFRSQRPWVASAACFNEQFYWHTAAHPCVYILFCSCFGVRTGWEDWDKCTDTYGICHLSLFRENCLPPSLSLSLPLPPSLPLSLSLQTCVLPGYSMDTLGKPCQLRMARVTL